MYFPSEEEKTDAALYAANVRAYMSKMSGIPPSDAGILEKAEYHKAIIAGKVGLDDEIERL